MRIAFPLFAAAFLLCCTLAFRPDTVRNYQVGVYNRDSVLMTMPGTQPLFDSLDAFKGRLREIHIIADSTAVAEKYILAQDRSETDFSPEELKKREAYVESLRHAADSIEMSHQMRIHARKELLFWTENSKINKAAETIRKRHHYYKVLDREEMSIYVYGQSHKKPSTAHNVTKEIINEVKK